MRVTIERTMGPGDAEALLGLYRASIAPLDEVAAGVQSFADDDFLEQLRNESVLKLVGRDRRGRPEALCLIATDLSDVPWISSAFFAARFPEQYERGVIYYIASVVVQPDNQGAGWAYALMKEVTRVVAESDGIAAFDCCSYNNDVIPELAFRVSTQFCDVEALEVDAQRFYAYVASGLRREAFAEADAAEREIELRTHEEAEEEIEIDLVAREHAEDEAARGPRRSGESGSVP
jgi:predicted GNAT superfamily acetyltransferase